MSVGDITQGRRAPDNAKRHGADSPVHPGDYGRTMYADAGWVWWARTPNGLGGNLTNHEVVEHDDGTITVSPSILVQSPGRKFGPTEWHGYLERGVWREV